MVSVQPASPTTRAVDMDSRPWAAGADNENSSDLGGATEAAGGKFL